MTAPFEYPALWNKAVLFINRALDTSLEFEEQAMWAANALELLGKAALAKRHPSLIADPVKGEGASLMMTAGVGDDYDRFVSIAAKTVYERCAKIAPKFNAKAAIRIAGNRNAYVHAGGPLCGSISPEAWWRDYWPLVNVLLAAQDRTLPDLVGNDGVLAVEAYISKSEMHAFEIVTARIARAEDVAARRLADSLTAAALAEIQRRTAAISQFYVGGERCPACGATGEVGGENEVSEERFDAEVDEDGDWFPGETRYEVSAESFACNNCGLILSGPQELAAAGIPDLFEVTETDDSFDYEPEYGND